ncbi:glycine dehydrogenase subunit 2 [Candidatus Desulfofervidus auxilii]|uniref:Probable glycine dehydrogenase (decarboxylating) subunit 2 n=1 Tax=Desulfofervidus auxilii TaxID=1621989 RepID=A0A7U4QIM7_DESA2|nr:aminomethyl-transferring glycine dehydrogenase subunit GcvPB [Candidatus Desulfofervidus auxilii]AMM40047.1 glycine dehydrogenase subunit 2 [Candidatus Desulfofervidus auxilii]
MQLIFEKSVKGRHGVKLPELDVPESEELPQAYRRTKAPFLPEVSELDVIRHFTRLSQLNYSIDTHFYPLGSCTMKYNPKFTEEIARIERFSNLHPLLPEELVQGALEVIYETERSLCEITGMDGFSLQPLAGAHGELTGLLLITAFHKHYGHQKKYVIVPDSSHGTNPASAGVCGYELMVIPTARDGCMDLKKYKEKLNPEVAAVMLTCPNTLGIFNPHIMEIADLAHQAGALLYYDGANLNAIMGKMRPGDVGFDVVHLNLHKTFATPHGGGGPGAGPIGVKKQLVEFLPIPRIIKKDGKFSLEYDKPHSIGFIAPFYGNFLVVLKAHAYILLLGKSGLISVSEKAVLNANYIRAFLKDYYDLPFDRVCMHECVFSAKRQAEKGIRALDIAKYLIDKGFHPPTIYFPPIVKEALMIEPTETESKETLDEFIEVMIEIAKLAEEHPDVLKNTPVTTPVKRLDEVKAARELKLRWMG